MSDSPVKTRATRKRIASQSGDKAKVGSLSSLPVNVAPNTDMPVTEMEAAVEACVAKHLGGDSIMDKLVDKLMGRIEKTMREVMDQFVKQYTDEIAALKEEVTVLQGKLQEAEGSRPRIDDLEQYQRRNNIRVFGIPEAKNEDTDELVTRIFAEKLGVDVSVDKLDRSHRVGSTPKPHPDGAPRHRPIIVRFTSYRDRRRVFESKRKLKDTGIVIREDLTHSRLNLVKAAEERFGRRRVWTMDGRVLWLYGDGRRGVATSIADLPEPDHK